MRTISTCIFAATLFIAGAAPVPLTSGTLDISPSGAINDFASLLPGNARQSLEVLSRSLYEKTGVSCVLVTVTDLEGADINETATRLFEKWGIGKKGADEGVLLLLSVKDRAVRIETGYGSEGYITDAQSSRIIRDMTPLLSEGKWDEGLVGAMLDIMSLSARAHGVSLNDLSAGSMQRRSIAVRPAKVNIFGILIFLVLVLFLLSTRGGRSILVFMMLSSLSSSGRSSGRGFGGGFGNGGFSGFGGGMSGGGGAAGRF